MDAIRQTMAQEVVRLQRKLATSEKERDALAAHNGDLRGALVDVISAGPDEANTLAERQAWTRAHVALSRSPAASLARHDDELRADTLAEVLALARTMSGDELVRELEYQGAELSRRLDDETDRAR